MLPRIGQACCYARKRCCHGLLKPLLYAKAVAPAARDFNNTLCAAASTNSVSIDVGGTPVKTHFCGILLGILTLVGATGHAAEPYPSKPITLIVPFTVGGTTDQVARILQNELIQEFGQPVIILNRVGAGGRVGTAEVARAAPDGYTMLVTFDSFPIDPVIYKDLPYDIWKDLAPVSLLVRAPLVAATTMSLPANSITELIAYAKANPGKVTFGSTGAGSSAHLFGEMFMINTGTKMMHVPYKGGANAMTDMMTGNLDIFWGSTAFAQTVANSGKVKFLAQTGESRNDRFPNVPTLKEQGLPSLDIYGWMGLLAPAGTPPEIIARWSAVLKKAGTVPSVADRYRDLGMEVVMSSPAYFADWLHAENKKWGDVIRTGNISVQ